MIQYLGLRPRIREYLAGNRKSCVKNALTGTYETLSGGGTGTPPYWYSVPWALQKTLESPRYSVSIWSINTFLKKMLKYCPKLLLWSVSCAQNRFVMSKCLLGHV